MKQSSLDKPCVNFDGFHNDFSLRKVDTVKHGVTGIVDFHYEQNIDGVKQGLQSDLCSDVEFRMDSATYCAPVFHARRLLTAEW